MKGTLPRLLALVPIPVVIFLLIWTGTRTESGDLVLKAHGTHGTHGTRQSRVKAVSLPNPLKSGWKVQGRVERYDEKTLFDRINGAAPAYIRAGFVYSLGAEYAKQGIKEPVVVDVYCMGSPARALGMYATERDASYSFIEVGQEGYLASSSLNFWQGQFYVKLAGYEEGVEKGLQELATDLAEVLPADPGKDLSPLGLLPKEGRAPHSHGYSHPALGDVDGLDQVFYADYGTEGSRFRLFVAPSKADERYGKVKAYFAKDGAKIQDKDGKEMVITGESTTSLALIRGQVLVGAIDLPDAKLVPEARARLLEIKP